MTEAAWALHTELRLSPERSAMFQQSNHPVLMQAEPPECLCKWPQKVTVWLSAVDEPLKRSHVAVPGGFWRHWPQVVEDVVAGRPDCLKLSSQTA